MKRQPKAIGYIRVSTSDQAIHGVSLDAQRQKIRAWAELNGYELGATYVDEGISGGKASNRPGLQKALDAACRQKAALVVYSLSRLARSTKDALDISERLRKAKADLVSLSERIDTTTAAGKMVFRMLAVLAEFERDLVSERTTAAMAHLKAQGRYISHNVPFGYDLDADGKHLVPNAAEQRTVAMMRRWRARSKSLRAIAAELNRRGVRTKQGKRWTHTQVDRTLKRAARRADVAKRAG
jgi:DNA invertase Pin-like site-specific DNA recombinase